MKNNLLFEFSVDKAQKTIHVTREFASSLELVWKAWTTAELLDQWWAPLPWKAHTKTMDFREGGYWHYAMVSPEGEKHWSKVSFVSIVPTISFVATDGFSDENGEMNPDFPQNLWENSFTRKNDCVQVDVLLKFDSLEDLEKIVAMGFREGFTMGLDQLDILLNSL